MKDLESYRMFDSSPLPIAVCEIHLGLYEEELGLVESAEGHNEDGLEIMYAYDLLHCLEYAWRNRLFILRANLLAVKRDNEQSDEVYNETKRSCNEKGWWLELADCRSRCGMSLARRGMRERTLDQFNEAMKVANRIGCKKRVQLFAKRVGIALELQGSG